jgi:hypothetical protein
MRHPTSSSTENKGILLRTRYFPQCIWRRAVKRYVQSVWKSHLRLQVAKDLSISKCSDVWFRSSRLHFKSDQFSPDSFGAAITHDHRKV